MESSLPAKHEDHIPSKGFTSMTHYNLVRKFIPMPQAMKILDAKAAVDKEWKKARDNSSNWRKSRARRRLFTKHKQTKKKVHFATLMDICDLKNAELEPKIQKKQRQRVVLRGDIVKDDSGAHAVSTEQDLSASQL